MILDQTCFRSLSFCTLLLGLVTASIETSYADRVITPKLTIRSVPGLSLLGLTVEALNAGSTVSQRIIPSPSPSGSAASGTFGQLLSGGKEENRQLIAGLDGERARIRGEVDALFAQAVAPVPPVPIQAAPVHEATYDLTKFKSCINQMLPKIGQLIRLENLGRLPDELDSLDPIELELSKEFLQHEIRSTRGDGTTNGIRGVICGKYLGRAGFNSLNLLEDYKLASLVAGRSGEGELERIVTTAVVANHRDTPPLVRQIWKKYWELLSFEASFKKDALPSWEKFRGQLGRYVPVEGLLGVMQMTSEELERHYAAGMEFAAAVKH